MTVWLKHPFSQSTRLLCKYSFIRTGARVRFPIFLKYATSWTYSSQGKFRIGLSFGSMWHVEMKYRHVETVGNFTSRFT